MGCKINKAEQNKILEPIKIPQNQEQESIKPPSNQVKINENLNNNKSVPTTNSSTIPYLAPVSILEPPKNITELNPTEILPKNISDPNPNMNESNINQSPTKPKTFKEKVLTVPWLYENFDINQMDLLGEGTFGKVFGSYHKIKQKYVAIKYINVVDEDEFNSMTKEINILSKLKNYGNVVHIEDKYIDAKTKEIYIVMERGDCNLRQIIQKYKFKVDPAHFLHIFSDLACGLLHAHENGVIHSDIKPANILVFKNQERDTLKNIQNDHIIAPNLVYKLTDWGAGTVNSTGKTTRLKTDMSYTTCYAAPELLIDEEHISFEKCDVYSLGMTMINCCGVAFEDMNFLSTITKKVKYAKELDEIMGYVDPNYGEILKNTLYKMLVFDRHERSNLSEVIETLKNIDDEGKEISLQKKQLKNRTKTTRTTVIEASKIEKQKAEDEIQLGIVAAGPKGPPLYEETEIPKHTPNIENTLNLIGPFKPKKETLELFAGLENKPPLKIDDNVYMGQWLEYTIREGFGKNWWPDGAFYEGFWKNNKANGEGRLIHADGDCYEGSWVDDLAQGYGKYIHSDGASYTGFWSNDKQHGKGEETWPDFSYYKGYYSDGKKTGLGSFKWGDGSLYFGEFLNNNINGVGHYLWADQRSYIGEWSDNKMHGIGSFKWQDGRKYIGEYTEDKKQGLGLFEWPDGRQYFGAWKNGKQHGEGFYIDYSGNINLGIWKDGKKEKNLEAGNEETEKLNNLRNKLKDIQLKTIEISERFEILDKEIKNFKLL